MCGWEGWIMDGLRCVIMCRLRWVGGLDKRWVQWVKVSWIRVGLGRVGS